MYSKLETNNNTTQHVVAKSIAEFNSYVDKYKTDNNIILTKSNNISQETLRHLPASLTWRRNNMMEFHYINATEHIRITYALAYDENNETDANIAWHAINYFSGLLELIPTDDIEPDSELFTCPENKSSAYYNYCNDRYIDMVLDNCYSLDRNSAFMAAMVAVYPQTKPFAEKFQADKIRIKNKPKCMRTAEEIELLQYDKIIIGWLKNSTMHRSHAWKKIISKSNYDIHQLRKQIEANGNIVLVVNTDAVKYIGEFNYNTNSELGGFKYEWNNTKMYIKSVKSYAYLDNDQWKFKQAGKCLLDYVKPRDTWTLEDFKGEETYEIAKIIIKNERLVEIYESI